MAHVFRAKTFIAPATALNQSENDGRGNSSMSKLVDTYIDSQDTGGTGSDIDEILSVSSLFPAGMSKITLALPGMQISLHIKKFTCKLTKVSFDSSVISILSGKITLF